MAGRGRGGKTGTFTQEQMQALGVVGKDLPQVTAPPPTFPPLMSKPISLETTAAQNYQILWKEDFLNHMRDSPYYVTPILTQRLRSEWSDTSGLDDIKLKAVPEFNYRIMPSELQLTSRKRRLEKKPKIIAKKANIEDRLKILEEKELNDGDEENEDQPKEGSDSEHEDEEHDPEAALDDEMDEENDYGVSYFDNGEAYNEEDDNLDDGPIY